MSLITGVLPSQNTRKTSRVLKDTVHICSDFHSAAAGTAARRGLGNTPLPRRLRIYERFADRRTLASEWIVGALIQEQAVELVSVRGGQGELVQAVGHLGGVGDLSPGGLGAKGAGGLQIEAGGGGGPG